MVAALNLDQTENSVSTGDASIPELSQDLNSLAGKILVNEDGTIPHDNPFSNSSVYAYGFGTLKD